MVKSKQPDQANKGAVKAAPKSAPAKKLSKAKLVKALKEKKKQQQHEEELKIIEDQKVENSINPKKQLLKHLAKRDTIESFYSGGNIVFFEKTIFGSLNNKVVEYNIEDKKIVRTFDHQPEEILNFAVNQQKTIIATFTRNGMLRIISIEDNKILKAKKISKFTAGFAKFDPSGALLILGDKNGEVKLFGVKDLTLVNSYQANVGLIDLKVFSGEKNLIIYTVGRDRFITVFDVKKGAIIKMLQKDEESFTSLCFSEDGKYLIAASFEHKLYVWDISKNWKLAGAISCTQFIISLECLTIHNSESKESNISILGGGVDGEFFFFLFNGETIRETEGYEFLRKTKVPAIHISVIRSVGIIAVVNSEANIHFLKIINLDGVPQFKLVEELSGYNHEVYEAKFLIEQGKKFVCVAANTNNFRIFDLQTKQNKFVYGHGDMVISLVVKGKYILTGAKDSTVKLWEFSLGEHNEAVTRLLCTFKGHINNVTSLAFSNAPVPDFFYSASADNTLKKWSIPSEVLETEKPKLMKAALYSIMPHTKDINAVRISRNSKLIGTASMDRYVKIFNSSDLSEVAAFKAHKGAIWDMQFSWYEKLVATCSSDTFIKIWSLEDYSCVATLESHQTSVLRIMWTALGSQIISSAADGEIKIWNYRKGTVMNTVEEAHDGKIWALDAYEEGSRYFLATGGTDSVFHIWEDDTKEVTKQELEASQELRENLTKLDLLLKERAFGTALKLAFDMDMRRGFVKAMTAFCEHYDRITNNIYTEIDDENDMQIERDLDKTREFEEILADSVKYFIEKDLKRFLHFIIVHVTATRYNYICGILINQLLKNTNIRDLNAYYDADKTEAMKSEKMLEAIKVYHSKHYERYEKFAEGIQLINFYISKAGILGKGVSTEENNLEGELQ